MARILVVDDNGPNRKLMLYLVRAFGHEAFEARHGDEALAMLEQQLADLVVCDLQMPQMDGFAFAKALRRTPQWARIPLVAVTALALVGDRERALAAGFDGYISKPIEPETFVAEVERFVRAANSAGSG